MAEAISLAASIIGVLQLTSSVISTCYIYQSGVRDAANNARKMNEYLVGMRSVLEQVDKLIQDPSGFRFSNLEQFSAQHGPLMRCKAELDDLKIKLEPKAGWKEKLRSLTWPLKEGDMKKSLEHLENFRELLRIAMEADHLSLARAIQCDVGIVKQDVKDVAQAIHRARFDDQLRAIREWLDAPDPSSNYHAARKLRQPTTGSWFINGDQFQQWKSGQNALLWLHGIPGSGKTILSSTVIEELENHSQSQSSFANAYFYFDFNNTEKQLSKNLIQTLITQLSAQCPTCPDALLQLHSHHRDGSRQPKTEDLIAVLKHLIETFQAVFIVADALDECTDRDDLLDFIEEMAKWGLTNLRILVTSRREQDIVDRLEPIVSGQVNLQSEVVDHDISIHIKARLLGDNKLKKWPVEIQSVIEETLLKGAQGMFRWVACQLDVLRKCHKLNMLMTRLSSLPSSLTGTYDQILETIDDAYVDDVSRILQWLAFSARPLSLAQVVEALAVTLDEHDARFEPEQRMPDPQDILRMCSSLVAISSSRKFDYEVLDWTEHSTIGLAHFSVKEYLVSDVVRTGRLSSFGFNQRIADTLISRTCLAYLLHFSNIPSLDQGITERFPLAPYAAEFWTHHAKSNDGSLPKSVLSLVLELLKPDSRPFFIWIRLHNPDQYIFSHTRQKEIPTALYHASLQSFPEVCDVILRSKAVDINAVGGNLGSALHAAVTSGHESVVRLLVENGADVNTAGGTMADGNALQIASKHGSETMVRLLLDHGADIDSRHKFRGDALRVASKDGHIAVVELLLDRGAKVNAQHLLVGSALEAASAEGHIAVVELLLNRGANINAQHICVGSALQAASAGGHMAVVELLLKRGADIHAQHVCDANALQAASEGGHEAIVRLLLENGANVNAQHEYEGNALLGASENGHEAVVKLLLANGADVNAEHKYAGRALTAASTYGHEAVVELLLENGANVNALYEYEGSVLLVAEERGHIAIVRRLLLPDYQFGYPRHQHRATALLAASGGWHEAVARLLLKSGADVNARNRDDRNALYFASDNGDKAMVRLLLENGADVNAMHETVLIAASGNGHEAVVRILLENGADVNAHHEGYHSALEAAAANGYHTVVRLLRKYGADDNKNIGTTFECPCDVEGVPCPKLTQYEWLEKYIITTRCPPSMPTTDLEAQKMLELHQSVVRSFQWLN